ncbi:MAG: helix-turn-helix transcriptional regulator [Bacteroidetes bacterium]|nr:helix-turn-helix transcriptional regulator [Bacteroidota bacterium]
MDIADRLKQLLEYYELSPSALADMLDVQRSSISHLLSGRNKPSLDFVMKILENFPEVDLYWFVNGKGKFPLNEKNETEKSYTLFSAIEESEEENIKDTPKDTIKSNLPGNEQSVDKSKEIDQIVILYSDKTFTNYTPKD